MNIHSQLEEAEYMENKSTSEHELNMVIIYENEIWKNRCIFHNVINKIYDDINMNDIDVISTFIKRLSTRYKDEN